MGYPDFSPKWVIDILNSAGKSSASDKILVHQGHIWLRYVALSMNYLIIKRPDSLGNYWFVLVSWPPAHKVSSPAPKCCGLAPLQACRQGALGGQLMPPRLLSGAKWPDRIRCQQIPQWVSENSTAPILKLSCFGFVFLNMDNHIHNALTYLQYFPVAPPLLLWETCEN